MKIIMKIQVICLNAIKEGEKQNKLDLQINFT